MQTSETTIGMTRVGASTNTDTEEDMDATTMMGGNMGAVAATNAGAGGGMGVNRNMTTGTPYRKIEVSRKSLIGQMMDPMNRNKSQQVLVIEHMVKSMADLVETDVTNIP
jgi:hypothetical protein